MAKAEKVPPKAKRKLTKKAQAERFKETARELGCDESPDALEKAFGQLNIQLPRKDLSPK
jgi:hypothetical protein